ncbi:MAG: nucleotidyltransferase domain-containing protein [Candidatus Hatepunaea meridiana]|nr:nucleotidyltransferase domain-containing protein [Candidatus Hatepunaea meridiana]
MINRKKTIELLKQFREKSAAQYGITEIGLFGSLVRDDRNENSDVDVVVKLIKQDLFNIIGIKQDLEETLNANVDIVSYREKMNAFLKKRIDKEAIYV